MPVQRFAGDALQVSPLLGRGVQAVDPFSAAFEYKDGRLVPSASSARVLEAFSGGSNKPLSLVPAASVEASGGVGIWGTGGGYFDPTRPDRIVADPMGPVSTVAHESAHALHMTPAAKSNVSRAVDPLQVDRDSGARLRYIHNGYSVTAGEEANAQGMAKAAMDKLGLPFNDLGWGDARNYPASYMTKGMDIYENVERGPASPGEVEESRRIVRGMGPYINRMYQQGYEQGAALFEE